MAKILICGGTGTIGKKLRLSLAADGHEIKVLSRSGKPGTVFWDPDKKIINPSELAGITHVVNLAGAGVMDQRWTKKYRAKILDSRVQAVSFLFEAFTQAGHMPSVLVGASAVGYYGTETGTNPCTEDTAPGTDFLAKVCVAWEKSYDRYLAAGCHTRLLRLGIVLDEGGGAYPPLAGLAKMGLVSPSGSGKQPFPWIHAEDVCGITKHLLFHSRKNGVYNAVAPESCSNRRFTKQLSESFSRKMWIPAVPGLFLHLVLGQRASSLLRGATVSAQKILEDGYRFSFPALQESLNDLKTRFRVST